ncbi:UreF Urease accessory protein UreF [Rhabdaerophilaceae bacterium]
MSVAEFQRLAWFSPAFPVGGFAYSHGIEAAAAEGAVVNGQDLANWISDILVLGTGRNDAIILGEAHRLTILKCKSSELLELSEFALALSQSRERRLESAQQGASFLTLIHRAWPHPALAECWPDDRPDPAFAVAVGLAGGLHGQSADALAQAYLQAFASNLLAAGLRLSLIGQSEAQIRLAQLQGLIDGLAQLATTGSLEDLGGSALKADLMALRHETLLGRLFRS